MRPPGDALAGLAQLHVGPRRQTCLSELGLCDEAVAWWARSLGHALVLFPPINAPADHGSMERLLRSYLDLYVTPVFGAAPGTIPRPITVARQRIPAPADGPADGSLQQDHRVRQLDGLPIRQLEGRQVNLQSARGAAS